MDWFNAGSERKFLPEVANFLPKMACLRNLEFVILLLGLDIRSDKRAAILQDQSEGRGFESHRVRIFLD